MELHLMDMSNYIYAGKYRKDKVVRGIRETNGEYEENAAPIGSITYFFDELRWMDLNNCVVMPVFDSPPTVKREMFEKVISDPYGYKGHRPAKPSDINIIRDYLRFILSDLGLPCQYAEGYEADDLIYTLVNMYKDDFEHIYIHTRDSDLSFLVSENVSIAKVRDLGKVINMQNYSTVCSKDSFVWYNTIHFRKLYSGDSSDNIPGVGKAWGARVDSVIPSEDIAKLGDLNLAKKYLREAVKKYPMEDGAGRLIQTFELICPLQVPYDLINDMEQDVNMYKLVNYYLAGFNQYADRWHLEDHLLDYIEKFYE